MQDDKPETSNNMQADENTSAEVVSVVTVTPGPSMLNWRKVAPNSVTILATVVGLSAFRLGIDGHFELGVLAILTAGLLDGLDGPVARALNGTSRFGAELDSLSDYVNFGVSPSLLMYFWSLHKYGYKGWMVCLTYTICMGCRLARFNAGVDFNASKVTRNFFMGVPAPAGALLLLLPMICTFQFGNVAFFQDAKLVFPFSLFVSFMLISRVPTFSSKMVNRTLFGKIGIVKGILFGLIIATILSLFAAFTWMFLIIITVTYMLSFPVSYAYFTVLSKRSEKDD